MKTSPRNKTSPQVISQVQVLRMRVATAETSWKEAKGRANEAKRRRKLAKQLAKRAQKEAKRAKAALAEAREALAETEAKSLRVPRPVRKKRPTQKAPARKTEIKSPFRKSPARKPRPRAVRKTEVPPIAAAAADPEAKLAETAPPPAFPPETPLESAGEGTNL